MRKFILRNNLSIFLKLFVRIKVYLLSRIRQKRLVLILKESYFRILKLLKEINLIRTNSYAFFRYFWYPHKLKDSRYENLIKTIYKEKSCNLIEVGTFDGAHAYQMIKTAQIFYPAYKVNYYGFDLFEDFTEEDMEKESSKRPPKFKYVKSKLESTKANIYLYKGYTKDTLPKFINKIKEENKKIDFILIDGGHSIETILLDWNYLKTLMNYNTVVILDDYYDNEGIIQKYGCNLLIDSLNRDNYEIKILEPQEKFLKDWGILKINMVKVRLKR